VTETTDDTEPIATATRVPPDDYSDPTGHPDRDPRALTDVADRGRGTGG